ncbi:uncharacterized protein F4812DRAFT_201402 [Daldinia caldariorum]|uniref:uncharacterized protein n=1 Tax=Daldinia caldariorum TaxID=326644 RepID=UPI0020083EF4|nr:uncharacterized protein F4812DRAFT_201402 [Daldinia caldariorum]KAI1471988.1 hypothetical protein F4812DRAFT_201402 [Daldinia caldariorum]
MPPGPIAGPSTASCSPAPYGQACVACSRAKCKCFYRADGSSCERCHRLGKTCEPAFTARKRKARRSPPPPPAPPLQPTVIVQQPPLSTNSTRVEEKLDELVSLLRSQAAEKQQTQQQQQQQQHTPPSLPEGIFTGGGDGGGGGGYTNSMSPISITLPVREHPDIAVDSTATIVHLLRPAPPITPSPIAIDVSGHRIPDHTAQDLLDTFRRSFIPLCPVVHIPLSTSAAELRRDKPFLWLVVMSLACKSISQQSELADAIWHIISNRVVLQHIIDLDVLLGIVCFGTWSYHLKEDKPHMCMLAQLAVTVALELNIHHDVSTRPQRRSRFPSQRQADQRPRTMEERRTMLALFHLTSATWLRYRLTEPLRWTSYLDDCLRILEEGKETYLDILLAMQVRCQIIINQLTCPPGDQPPGVETPKITAPSLVAALVRELHNIRRKLPADIEAMITAQFYLCFAEMKIRETVLYRPRTTDQTGTAQFQRLQDLDAVLTMAERWFSMTTTLPPADWHGLTADLFTHCTQYLIVLFRLATLDEPGWDLDDVRRRADVFAVIDRCILEVERVPPALGMVDAEGARSGFFFKLPLLLRDVKVLFIAEMQQQQQQQQQQQSNPQLNPGRGPGFPAADNIATSDGLNKNNDNNNNSNNTNTNTNNNRNNNIMPGFGEDMSFADENYLNMVQEEMLAHVWDFRPDASYLMPFLP